MCITLKVMQCFRKATLLPLLKTINSGRKHLPDKFFSSKKSQPRQLFRPIGCLSHQYTTGTTNKYKGTTPKVNETHIRTFREAVRRTYSRPMSSSLECVLLSSGPVSGVGIRIEGNDFVFMPFFARLSYLLVEMECSPKQTHHQKKKKKKKKKWNKFLSIHYRVLTGT
ncbi:hypothetical protein CDAR_61331 [Caerostris darwini]|uniref:Uncharacterized protein n=1 Tax=Caerostris darwini TaxID=1538125 RepID=A0AAV4X192_9ARAC|nr:hypothetical protein CDAR_61331 [Caerostris darwini]